MLFTTAKEIPTIRGKIEREEIVNSYTDSNVEIDQQNVILSNPLMSKELAPLDIPTDKAEDALTPPKTLFIEVAEELVVTPNSPIKPNNTHETISARDIDKLPPAAKRLYVTEVVIMDTNLAPRLK